MSVVVGAILGAVATVLVQHLLARRNMDVALLNEQAAQVSVIEGLAIDYWTSDAKDTFEKEKLAASRLRGALHATSYFRADGERIFANSFGGYLQLDAKLFDCTTGDDFESIGRLPRADKVIEVNIICHQMRAMLRAQRRNIFGAY